MTPKLTKPQQEVLNAIKLFIKEKGYSPVFRELCEMTGKKSPSTTFRRVCELEEKGYVKTTPGQMRSIRLCATPTFVRIITCKECKYWHKVNTGLAIWDVCHKLNRQTADDFYCAYGEEKNNAD